MAVRFDASGDSLYRTTQLPSTTSFTLCGWANRIASTGNWTYFASLETPTVNSTQWLLIGYKDTQQFHISSDAGGGSYYDFSSTPSTGTWFFWSLSCSGTGAGQFIGRAALASDATFQTVSGTGTSFTAAHLMFGNDSWGDYLNGRLAAVKVWNAVLTEAELYNERWSFSPRRMANLTFFNPFINHADATRDWTGTANLSAGGTLATEDNPPIGWRLTKSRIFVPTAGPPPVAGRRRGMHVY